MRDISKNYKISTKLSFGVFLFLVGFVFFNFLAGKGINQLVKDNDDFQNGQIYVNNVLQELIDESNSLSTLLNSIFLEKATTESIKNKVSGLRSFIRELPSGAGYSTISDDVIRDIASISLTLDEIYRNAETLGGIEKENAQFPQQASLLSQSIEKLNDQLSGLLKSQNIAAAGYLNEISLLKKAIKGGMILRTSIIFLLVILVYVYIMRRLGSSIRKTLKFTEQLAQGNLFAKSELQSDDEIGMINASLEELKNRFKDVIASLLEISQNIEVASNEFRSGSQVISDGANDQAAASAEISAAMDQISSMQKQLSSDAHKTDDIAKMAFNGIIQGAESVENALTVIEEIAQKNSVISEISYQTKILSINASVEAARAAEMGRGFAVVAEEVKRLAESSQQSASEISKVSKKGVNITRESAIELRNLVPEFQKTSELVNEIAKAGEENVITLDQISLTIHELNNIIQQNASSSEELTASSEELVRLAESLNSLVGFFKIEEESNAISQSSDQQEVGNDVDDQFADDKNSYSNWGNQYNEKSSDHVSFSFDDDEPNTILSEMKSVEVDASLSGSEPVLEEMEVLFAEKQVKPSPKSARKSSNIDDSITKPMAKGVRINLSDNDNFDDQFEKIR